MKACLTIAQGGQQQLVPRTCDESEKNGFNPAVAKA